MTKKHDNDTPDTGRRRLLGGMATTGAMLALGGAAEAATAATPKSGAPAPTGAALDALLEKHIHNVVVIYAENRSFNNLFGNFPGLLDPLKDVPPERYIQRDRDGSVLKTLPKIWGGLVPHEQTVDHRTYKIAEDAITGLPNAPWELHTGDGTPLPHGVVTRDLVHAFYNNQLQINGGKNDGFVAWGDNGALTMGHYANTPVNLRLWRLAEQFTLCDRFFMGAFGGSFLNHQYLVAAQPPFYPEADKSPSQFGIAVTESGSATDYRLKMDEKSPKSAMEGKPKFAHHNQLTPDFYAVNTMGPPYSPGFNVDRKNPLLADATSANTLVPQKHKHIGDVLSAKNVDWAWYGGGFQAALDGKGDSDDGTFPSTPNFQAHHQPLNYFETLAPGTDARAKHLRDGGLGESPKTNKFLADAKAGKLPAVAYYKPQGDLNMHAGYSDVEAGDRHISSIVHQLQQSPQWKNMLVIITFDENGGWWDHVAPPKGDRWGPGTRIPALVVSPFAKKGHVEHTMYDTGSISRFLTRRFKLEKLAGLQMRDDATVKAGGPAPGDLTETLTFS
jgi:acid phosphatase